MMKMKMMLCVCAALCAGVLLAAPAATSASDAPAFKSSFEKPPSAAAKALKQTIGKPIKTGFVFVDGKYVAPPYTVTRYGTAIRINGIQVTGEIVAWDEFLKTQDGATVTKSEEAVEDFGGEAEEEEEEDFDDFDFGDDDSESSLDDLFDDEPAPKKESKKPAKKKSKPKPKKPKVTVTVSFDGTFEANETTKGYVDKINQERTRIDKLLRNGGYCFFGSRYAAVYGDSGAARVMLDKLPEMMRSSASADALTSSLYNAGFVQFSRALIADLFKNRYAGTLLIERRKALKEDQKWEKILGSGM